MKKKNILALSLIIFSLIIFIYQLGYSESARIKKNLDDFDYVSNFSSSEVPEIDINKIYKEQNDYSFTIVDEQEASNFQNLGVVYMNSENGYLINSFTLLKNDEKYLLHMREVYMLID